MESKFCQKKSDARITEATAAWLGSMSRAMDIKRKSSKKNKGEVAPPVEKISKRQMEFRMAVDRMSK